MAAVVVLASASVTETESNEDKVVGVVVTSARACFWSSVDVSTCISMETEVNIEIEVVV